MGRFTGKKRKLNYKPILLVAAVAVPIIVGLTILFWPEGYIRIKFDSGPTYDPHLSERGAFRVSWQTNLETRGTVHYRYLPGSPYYEMPAAVGREHVVSVPGKPGDRVEFFVEVEAGRDKLRSSHFTAKLIKSASSTQAGATRPTAGNDHGSTQP